MKLDKTTVEELLNRIDSEKPLPSAGASLAVVAAIGVSLLRMALKISLKKRNSKELKDCLNFTGGVSLYFLRLGEEDMKAFSGVLQGEMESKEKALRVPLDIAKICLQQYQKYTAVQSLIYHPVRGDGESGLLLLKTCAYGCLKLVRHNLCLLEGTMKIDNFKKELNRVEGILNNIPCC